jgi:hypothetical protein
VIVAVPVAFGVIVTVVPLMLAVATPVELDATLNVPLLVFLLTVKFEVVEYAIEPLVELNVRAFVPFTTVNA